MILSIVIAVIVALALVGLLALFQRRRSEPVIDVDTTYVAESVNGEVVVRKDWRLTITNRGPVDLHSVNFSLAPSSMGRSDIDYVLLDGAPAVAGSLGPLKVGDFVSVPYRALRAVESMEGPGHFGYGFSRLEFEAKSLLFRWTILSVDIEIRDYPVPARARCHNGHLTAVSFAALDSIRRDTSPSVLTNCAECQAPITASFNFS